MSAASAGRTAGRAAVLLAGAAISSGCGGGTDGTRLCESCVADTTEAPVPDALDARRDAAAAPEYAFLEQSSLSGSDLAAAWRGLPYERIGLTRTSCFANCPEYSLVFIRGTADETRARALYDGQAVVPNLGAFEGAIGIREYALLCEIVDRIGFLELEPEYRAPWPGDATTIVEVRHRMGSHAVVDYGRRGPPELSALEWALDGAAIGIDWQPLPEE